MAPMAITDFTASERRTLAIIAMAIDDVPAEGHDAARRLLGALRDVVVDLDDNSIELIADACVTLGRERRVGQLLEYLLDDRPLVTVQSEIFHAVGADG